MSAGSNGVVFGGELAVAGVLAMNSLGSAIGVVFAESAFEQLLSGAIAIWLGALAWLLPAGPPMWHVAALVTTIVGCLFSLLAIAGGMPIAAFPALCFGAVAIYLALTMRRKRAVHGI